VAEYWRTVQAIERQAAALERLAIAAEKAVSALNDMSEQADIQSRRLKDIDETLARKLG
jgi:hypothetical protein